ncbi:hypothetical protein MTR_0030s0190 [Medicago truncatula]|uniref:Uncharacterized protein n=1 Tax=Medicago truncatula TaxID=3880 RepID=G7ZUG9_MEDTR|nr:hypothetical protein MTR_0030s0190 [Medicago truncatula]
MGENSWGVIIVFEDKRALDERKFPLEQLTPYQMGSSWTPTRLNNPAYVLSTLSLLTGVLGYGTRAYHLELKLISTNYLGDHNSGLSFTTSLSSKPKTHGWFFVFLTTKPLD